MLIDTIVDSDQIQILTEFKKHTHTQYLEKLNVWAGILNNVLIGPFLI